MKKWLVPVIAAGLAYWALAGFGGEKASIGALFALTVSLWITAPIPIAATALLSTSLLVLTGRAGEKAAFVAYGDPIVPLFIGSFILAKAMELTGLSDRFAYYILVQKWANKSPKALLWALAIVPCVLSLMVSNTATTAMMLPIGLSLLAAIKSRNLDKPYAIGVMLMLTWASSVAVGLPVGTPPNLIGLGLIEKATGTRIGFIQWMAFGMPITIVTLACCWGILWMLYGKNAPETSGAAAVVKEGQESMGKLQPSEKAVLAAFSVALIGWMLPDMFELALGKKHELTSLLQTRVPPSVPALLAVALLFAIPCKDKSFGHAITWKEAATIDWGTILLFAGGIAMGQSLFETGLAKDLGQLAATAAGAKSVWAITALCTAAAIVLSELASNTAAATTLVPVAIGLAESAGVSVIPPALGVAIGASFGFMLPVSTAPNAIVYSSGLVPSKEMVKAGLILDVVAFVVIVACLYFILPMLGLA